MPGSDDGLIFHVTSAREWAYATAAVDYRVSTRGKTLDEVGFIHASSADQYERIGALVFGDSTDPLVVLVIDPTRLTVSVVVEDLAGDGESFPHIYGPLPVAAVVDVLPARIVGGRLVVRGPV